MRKILAPSSESQNKLSKKQEGRKIDAGHF
jgi:hypothetical protein